jgi:hypothetical protein
MHWIRHTTTTTIITTTTTAAAAAAAATGRCTGHTIEIALQLLKLGVCIENLTSVTCSRSNGES